jgi:hypothetical protein
MTPVEKLLHMAESLIGTDVTPLDRIPDAVACAESVSAVYRKTFNRPIGDTDIVSTNMLHATFQDKTRFLQIFTPEAGCIIISPTFSCRRFKNGHVGIVSSDMQVMNNNSKTGKWLKNYTIERWQSYFCTKGRCVVQYYRVL